MLPGGLLDRMQAAVRRLTVQSITTDDPEVGRQADALRSEWVAGCEETRAAFWRRRLGGRADG